MTRIPTYDATAPIVCTASSDEIQKRLEQVERMREQLERIERTDHGMLLHFPNAPEIADDLHRFTVDEKACCQFWGFDITEDAEKFILRWDAPPDLADYVDRLMEFFEGDESLSSVSGLL